MRLNKFAKAAVLGFSGFVAGLAWAAIHEYLAKLDDPPGWIMDREIYQPAAFLARMGLVVFVIAGVCGIGRSIYRRIAK